LLGLYCEVSHQLRWRWLNKIDPRTSLSARIGWLSAVVSIIFSLITGLLVGSYARGIVEKEIGALYADRAQHIADAIDLKIQSSISAVEVAASFLGNQADDGRIEANPNLIHTIKDHIGGTIWTGVTDNSGKIVAGNDGKLVGINVSDEPWFKVALKGVSTTGPATFGVLERELSPIAQGRQRKFLFLTSPIVNDIRGAVGFAVAVFDMQWLDDAQRIAGQSLATARPVDIFLLGRDGIVLNELLEGDQASENDLSDRISNVMQSVLSGNTLGSLSTDNYLVGFARSRLHKDPETTDWTVVVREAKQSAFATAAQTAWFIGLSCLALGLGISLAAAFGTALVLRGLASIARSADDVQSGANQGFNALQGRDEVARISKSLASLFTELKRSNTRLEDLNRDLDRKVVERTDEVRRLSEETKNAAIIRERLRMSRDIHDTLAHSMLAVLTQLRMTKKIFKARPELAEDEIDRAEQAASDGLAIARNAVTSLRYVAVRDDGLKEALIRLIKRTQERLEIEATLDIDDAVASLAGETAEAVYRVAEEALHNVEKHARAKNVNIEVKLDLSVTARQLLTLIVTDDGIGFDLSQIQSGQFGLVGMREQADLVEGKLTLESIIGKGTTVRLEVMR
jgi:signal transduction histidine kinase